MLDHPSVRRHGNSGPSDPSDPRDLILARNLWHYYSAESASFGFISPTVGLPLLQEVFDVAVILNAVRAR